MTSAFDDVVENAMFGHPTLVMDFNRIEQQYNALKAGLGPTDIHYVVKANPAPEIILRLVDLGSHFDLGSRGEIELVLVAGAKPADVSIGSTIKRASDIAYAHAAGVTLFSADAAEEIEKIAQYAPGAQVYVRLIVESTEADWPLSRKFGFDPVGLSFHVGSQTRKASMWGLLVEAGAVVAEVMLVSRDLHRWVYLSTGRFSGLAEPSCDSADVRYEKQPVLLPMTLKASDRIVIRDCGAYTSSYSSVGFNGFPPLDVSVI